MATNESGSDEIEFVETNNSKVVKIKSKQDTNNSMDEFKSDMNKNLN